VRAGSPAVCWQEKGDGEDKEKENVGGCGCLSRGSQGEETRGGRVLAGPSSNLQLPHDAVWCNGSGQAKERRLIDYGLRLQAPLLFF